MSEPKLTEAQAKALTNALWHHYNNGAKLDPFVARMIADAEQAARAEAWDEGFEERHPTTNPYRSTP